MDVFTREPRSAAESTSDFVVVMDSLPTIDPYLAGNGLHLQALLDISIFLAKSIKRNCVICNTPVRISLCTKVVKLTREKINTQNN